MYNLLTRLNALFAFSTTIIFVLLGAIAIITTFIPSSPEAKIVINELGVYPFKYGEFAHIELSLKADLTSLFNWNVKQIFLMIVSEYETKTHDLNQIVLWDTIVDSQDNAIIEVDIKNIYDFVDINNKFNEVNSSYSLHWDIMPCVGLLKLDNLGPSSYMNFETGGQNNAATTHYTSAVIN
nr:15026_t:CDS:2 [Entrophospora candida]